MYTRNNDLRTVPCGNPHHETSDDEDVFFSSRTTCWVLPSRELYPLKDASAYPVVVAW